MRNLTSIFVGKLKIPDYPLNSIKGKICTQTLITEFVEEDNKYVEFSILNLKPTFKVHVCIRVGLGLEMI